jgi:hypothetical protein
MSAVFLELKHVKGHIDTKLQFNIYIV